MNCWKNLSQRAYIPYNISWGVDNRNTLIRVKNRNEKNTFFENRLVCSAANPYLCLAVTIASGIDGIRRELKLPAHIEEEAYKLGPEVCLPLPRTLEESLDALNQNQILVDSLGKEFVKCFTAIKKHEIQLYKANEGNINWEKQYYFQHL